MSAQVPELFLGDKLLHQHRELTAVIISFKIFFSNFEMKRKFQHKAEISVIGIDTALTRVRCHKQGYDN